MAKISIDWAPNAEKDDILLAISLIFRPWKWGGQTQVEELEQKLGEIVQNKLIAFDSARSALFALLKTIGIGKGDEVLLQAFTCVALPNPILWTGAQAVYIDVDLENLNLDLEDLESKITPKTKAVIVQYTFGICPDIFRLKQICDKHNLILIEDCCHNLGQRFLVDGKEIFAGGFGDIAIFSMGMEKIISATRAGFAVVNPGIEKKIGKTQDEIFKKLKKFQKQIPKARVRDILRGILNPIVWKIRQNFGVVGEVVYKLANKLKLHELGLTKLELTAQKASWLPYQMPNPNAILGLNQIKKLNKFNHRRKENALLYNAFFGGRDVDFSDKQISRSFKLFVRAIGFEKTEVSKLTNKTPNRKITGIRILDPKESSKYAQAMYLRYPVFLENAADIRDKLKTQGVYLGNWYTEVIHSKGVDLEALGYKKGSCPRAEWLTKRTINLIT